MHGFAKEISYRGRKTLQAYLIRRTMNIFHYINYVMYSRILTHRWSRSRFIRLHPLLKYINSANELNLLNEHLNKCRSHVRHQTGKPEKVSTQDDEKAS